MSSSLSVRNLDDALVDKLKARAASHGRSTEAEVREILKDALSTGASDQYELIAAELRRRTAGRFQTPSEILQREGRDER